jgi:hypothetical protein
MGKYTATADCLFKIGVEVSYHNEPLADFVNSLLLYEHDRGKL